jgi:hypothetical protein
MGLFGDIDVSEVPDNPFYVAPGTYDCVLTEASRITKKDQSGEGLSIKWVIEDEDSDYNGQNVQDWFNIYPDITSDEVTPNIKKDMSRLKQRLSQMGLAESDMNTFLDDLDEYVGMHAQVTVKETPDKNNPDIVYTNIVKVEVES